MGGGGGWDLFNMLFVPKVITLVFLVLIVNLFCWHHDRTFDMLRCTSTCASRKSLSVDKMTGLRIVWLAVSCSIL